MTIAGSARKPVGASRLGCAKALLVDLDDTLYRNHNVPTLVRAAIQKYMVEKLGVAAADVESITQTLYYKHGTTMAGLVAEGHDIDFDDWHQFIHHNALDYNAMLSPDILLREMLCSIAVPKYILTNADTHHAKLCLERLGIADCFQGVFDFEWVMGTAQQHGLLTPEHPVMCKPNRQVYDLVLEAIGCTPSDVLFFDDSARNIASAHDVGLMTCLVGTDNVGITGADLALPDMHALPAAVPELFDQPGLVHAHHTASCDGSVAGVAAVAAAVATSQLLSGLVDPTADHAVTTTV